MKKKLTVDVLNSNKHAKKRQSQFNYFATNYRFLQPDLLFWNLLAIRSVASKTLSTEGQYSSPPAK